MSVDYKTYFAGKKITVMGLGLLGRAIADTRFLAEAGAELIVTDLKDAEQLAESVAQLQGYGNITWRLGEHVLEDFEGRDYVLKAPNVPLGNQYIAHAEAEGAEVKMSLSWAMEVWRAAGMEVQLIGVTGSKGKSTTTAAIEAVLQAAGLSYHVAGNVRGAVSLPLLDKVQPSEVIVAELDSWQLQGFGAAGISPQVAVWTSFFADHMDYYGGDMQRYFDDKAQIYRHQRAGDQLIVSEQAWQQMQEYDQVGPVVQPEVVEAVGVADWQIKLIGAHNQANVALAAAVGRSLGLDETVVRQALESYNGVAGRLQYMGDKLGASWYNDNASTTPDSSIANIRAVAAHYPDRRLVVVAGGGDKAASLKRYAAVLGVQASAVVLLAGTASDQLLAAWGGKIDWPVMDRMAAVFEWLREVVADGDVVVFSPGASSKPLFANMYDRQDQWVANYEQL